MRKLITSFLIGSFLLFPVSQAKVSCKVADYQTTRVWRLPDIGYWMQAAGNDRITFTAPGGINSQLFSMEQDRRLRINRGIDAFALPEGDLYIQPSPLRFFPFDSQGEGTGEPLFVDHQHDGYYQSVGMIRQESNSRIVRVLTAQGRGRVQDYRVNRSDNGTYSFSRIHSHPIELCHNLGRRNIDFEMPVLSRDGRMFATRDLLTGNTVVYDIEIPSGRCTRKLDLGVATDKVSFSFDNDRFSYATLNPRTGERDIHVHSISRNQSIQVTAPPEEGLYHTWRQDGTFLYTRAQADNRSEADLVQLPMNEPSFIDRNPENERAIGRAWASSCGGSLRGSLSEKELEAIGRRSNRSVCVALASQSETPHQCRAPALVEPSGSGTK
jgi:hypothetical protein